MLSYQFFLIRLEKYAPLRILTLMTVTTNHSASSYGQPVILDDDNRLMDYAPGVRAIRRALKMEIDDIATACGVSPRTVEGWEQGRLPSASALNVLGDLLVAREN